MRASIGPWLQATDRRIPRADQASANVPFGALLLSNPEGWEIVDYKTDCKLIEELLAAYASSSRNTRAAGRPLPEKLLLPRRSSACVRAGACNLRLKITLLHTKVWREVLLPADFTLAKLHTVIQFSMGWEDCHLHDFSSGRTKLSEKLPLSQVFSKVGAKILYTYDYGDSWDHEVKLLGRSNAVEDSLVPSCADGKFAGPPEDCGGVPGYEELCELMARSDLDEEEQERVDWAGDWQPLAFDREAANHALAKKFKLKGKKAAPPKAAEAKTFTDRQGQYLAFIFWSTRINRCPPAQTDIQSFFGVSAPTVQQMSVTLEKSGFLTRIPGQARVIQVTVEQSQLPPLEEPSTPMVVPGRGWVQR